MRDDMRQSTTVSAQQVNKLYNMGDLKYTLLLVLDEYIWMYVIGCIYFSWPMLRTKILYKLVHSMKATQLKVELAAQERQLFQVLMCYRNQLKLKTVLRVAGGWVRDKILQIPAKDIDIALDDMKGQQFVILLKEHSIKRGELVSGIGVTRFNPEMSKHLETATAKICNQTIDFVNLRAESYTQNSRIPTMRIGTPLEDAMRRDFTINSLFYNINENTIEDWTELGLTDLQQGVLRTPLAPLETFNDDPLRILRCLRFYARFGFSIDQSILTAMNDQNIKTALTHKVSKERVGIEVGGMLKEPKRLQALKVLVQFGYWPCIVQSPHQYKLPPGLVEPAGHQAIAILHSFEELIKHDGSWHYYQLLIQTEQQQVNKKIIQYTLEQLSLMIPLACILMPYYEMHEPIQKTKETIIEIIAKNDFKYSAKVAKFAHKSAQGVRQLFKLTKSQDIPLRSLVKWLRSVQQKWELCILLLTAINRVNGQVQAISPLKVRQTIEQIKLQQAYATEAWIDGKFLTTKGKKGPIMKTILENAVIWRIMNPASTLEQFVAEYEANPMTFQVEDKN